MSVLHIVTYNAICLELEEAEVPLLALSIEILTSTYLGERLALAHDTFFFGT